MFASGILNRLVTIPGDCGAFALGYNKTVRREFAAQTSCTANVCIYYTSEVDLFLEMFSHKFRHVRISHRIARN